MSGLKLQIEDCLGTCDRMKAKARDMVFNEDLSRLDKNLRKEIDEVTKLEISKLQNQMAN
jgi:hypothetical protein